MTSSQLTAKLLIEIPKLSPRVRVWRANVVAVKAGDRFVRAGLPGQGDIGGVIGPRGKILQVEIKVGKDRQSPKQIAFQSMIESLGGVYIIARELDEALRQIQTIIAVENS